MISTSGVILRSPPRSSVSGVSGRPPVLVPETLRRPARADGRNRLSPGAGRPRAATSRSRAGWGRRRGPPPGRRPTSRARRRSARRTAGGRCRGGRGVRSTSDTARGRPGGRPCRRPRRSGRRSPGRTWGAAARAAAWSCSISAALSGVNCRAAATLSRSWSVLLIVTQLMAIRSSLQIACNSPWWGVRFRSLSTGASRLTASCSGVGILGLPTELAGELPSSRSGRCPPCAPRRAPC